jgi:hypothetical protein
MRLEDQTLRDVRVEPIGVDRSEDVTVAGDLPLYSLSRPIERTVDIVTVMFSSRPGANDPRIVSPEE